ncbi:hypothetical protein AALB39_15210 [Lachnospiraceae bacterium 54-53]
MAEIHSGSPLTFSLIYRKCIFTPIISCSITAGGKKEKGHVQKKEKKVKTINSSHWIKKWRNIINGRKYRNFIR